VSPVSPPVDHTPEQDGEFGTLQPVLGERLRAFRKQKGLSLSDVADRTGISLSFLSLVENGKSDLSVSRLIKLVGIYKVHLSDLLPDAPAQPDTGDPEIVVRRRQRQHMYSRSEGVELSLLSPDANRTMMPVISVYGPHCHMNEFAVHEGEEFAHVLQGAIEINFADDRSVVLEEGDSAYFNADRPHSYSNPSNVTATVLSVVSPPSL
jgi:transcriptional regulator with XRE-family HTH domain